MRHSCPATSIPISQRRERGWRGEVSRPCALTSRQGWGATPGRQGLREVPEQGQGGESGQREVAGAPRAAPGWVPGKPGATLTSPHRIGFPTPRLATGE